MNQEPEDLADQLRHTQDRVMALEAQVRVLVACLLRRRVLPPELLSNQLTEAMRQLHHHEAGEEFPMAHRAIGVLRDWIDGLDADEFPP